MSLTDSGSHMGALGGHTWTLTGFDLSLERTLLWGPTSGTAVGMAFDGNIDQPGETMTYDASQPDLANGKEHWSGSATFNGATWNTRFTLTVTQPSGLPIPLGEAPAFQITTGAGAVMQVVGDFKATLVMEAQPPGGLWQAPEPAFDAATPHTDMGLVTSFDAGFYPVQPRLEVLPAMSNAAYGGYTTATYLQDTGSATANVFIAYFDQSGNPVGTGDSVSIPVHGGATVRQDNGNSFPTGVAGSAVVFSDQPVAAFVNEFAPGNASDATSFTGIPYPSGVGSTLFAPAIASLAYGGYTTGIGLINLSTQPATITITYRDAMGIARPAQTLASVPPRAYRGVYSGNSGQPTDANLPSGFAGTATIQSSAGLLAAVVNETGPGGQFSSYDAVAAQSSTLFAPVALNNAFGGFNTGIGIQNTTATAGTVTIDYYDTAGALAHTSSTAIPAYGYLGVYQGTDIPNAGAYTAVISAPPSTISLAAIVNEVARPSTGGAQQSTSYNTFVQGAGTSFLPLVESNGSDGWSTGQGIMNTGSTPASVTVTYYDVVSGNQVGTTQSTTLAPKAFWGVYQPTGGLPATSRATAIVQTASGGQVAVICNESNSTSFMSYDGQ